MINTLINHIGGKRYPIYKRKMSRNPHNGGDMLEYSYSGKVAAYIQTADGMELKNAQGDYITADFVMYHKDKLSLHDRVEIDGVMYEIRSLSPYSCKFLEFQKSYLVKNYE